MNMQYKYPQRIMYTESKERNVKHLMLKETQKYLDRVQAQYVKSKDADLLPIIEQIKQDIEIYQTNYEIDKQERGKPRLQYQQCERADVHLDWCGCPRCRPMRD